MKKSIKIYTTNWCSYCDLAKRFFNEKGWDYEEINIEILGWDRSKLLEVGKATTVPQIVIDGEPIGVINRIPKPGEFKANLHLGGMASKTTLTKIETRICRNLKSFLKINKLFFVGIDLIDEKLTEINVTSPTGITQMNELSDKNLSIMFWEKLIKKI